MNKIVFAGRIAELDGERVNKCLEVIVPSGGERKLISGGIELDFGGRIAVIPAYCKYSVVGHSADDLHVLIEQALTPLKRAEVISDVANDGIRHACLQAEEFLNGGYDLKDLVLSALGELIMSYAAQNSATPHKLSPVTAQVLEDMQAHISDVTYSLEDSIKKLPLNYDYVRKLFKREVGVTPHEYLTRERMDLAQKLILSEISNRYSAYSVSQIAEACGFSEPLYFSRVFKKFFGVAPSEYGKK